MTRSWWRRGSPKSPAPRMAEPGPAQPLEPLVAFGRGLRARGLPVGTGRILTFVRAVAALRVADRSSLYWAGRISMIARRDDLRAYDAAFEEWYRSLRPESELTIELDLPSLAREAGAFAEVPDGLEVPGPSTAAEWQPLGSDD